MHIVSICKSNQWQINCLSNQYWEKNAFAKQTIVFSKKWIITKEVKFKLFRNPDERKHIYKELKRKQEDEIKKKEKEENKKNCSDWKYKMTNNTKVFILIIIII